MKRKYIIFFIFSLPLLIPMVGFIHWWLKETRPMRVLIYDMTVPVPTYDEHNSFSWILINQKYTSQFQLNNPATDYKGFFPLKDFKFVTKDFSKLSPEVVQQVADSLDMAYYTDTYGVFSNEWLKNRIINERSSKIYGGLNRNDLLLIKRFQETGKLLLAEFNFLANPTDYSVRREAEKLLDLSWTGWAGRYYDTLDTLVNPDIPEWAKKLYVKQYSKPWNFHQAGILFVHERDIVVVLEMDATLEEEVPWIYTSKYGQQKYGLPAEFTYPYWFDIMESGSSNRIVSKYKIYPSKSGRALLKEHGIPDEFPCVIENREKNYYYFCGDFCDNPIRLESAKFSGGYLFRKFFYNKYNYIDRTPFFWNFYRPMVIRIMEEYNQKLIGKQGLGLAPKAAAN
jgi:hypothetical protein